MDILRHKSFDFRSKNLSKDQNEIEEEKNNSMKKISDDFVQCNKNSYGHSSLAFKGPISKLKNMKDV